MTNDLLPETKEIMKTNAMILVSNLISTNQPFRLVIWNNDDWEQPLSDEILKDFPMHLVLDIKDETLEQSFVDKENNRIFLSARFKDSDINTKELLLGDTVGVLTLEGQPMIINSFTPEETLKINSTEDLVKLVSMNGIKKEDAERSMKAFIKNNKGLQ